MEIIINYKIEIKIDLYFYEFKYNLDFINDKSKKSTIKKSYRYFREILLYELRRI